jgi:hypothetical protein
MTIRLLLLAILPWLLPWSAPEKQNATTMEVVAALGAPQVGLEPTTLRLTVEKVGPELAKQNNHLATTPLVRCRYGSTRIHVSAGEFPDFSPDFSAVKLAHRRGYWSAAPPDSVRGAA